MTSIASFNGGMGNDESLLAENQFVYSENIDIYRDPRKIQLAVKPTSFKTGMTSLALIMTDEGSIEPNTRETYYCLENKDIIDGEGDVRFDGSTLRPKSTGFGNWRAFLSLGSDNSIFFFDYKGGIIVPNYINTPAAAANWTRITDSKDWTNFAFDMVVSDPTGTLSGYGNQRPVYQIGNQFFFADGVDHRNIERTSLIGGMPGIVSGPYGPGYPTITAYPQGISQPGETVTTSVHSDSVWTIGNNSTQLFSEMSAISVVAGVASSGVKQLLSNVPIKFLHGVNKNNQDILIAGNVKTITPYPGGGATESIEYSSIYIYGWYGFGVGATPLMAKSRYHQNIARAFDNHGITYYLVGTYGLTDYNWAAINDLVYCISNKDDVGLIYAYGKSVGGVNDGWSVAVATNSQGKKMKRIGCLYRNYAKNGFYYTYEDVDGLFGVDYFDDISIDNPTSFQPSGKIFLRTDDGGDLSVKKEVAGQIKLGCEVPADTNIELSFILDDGPEQSYATITPTTQGTSAYKAYRGDKPIRGFGKISWFATLRTTGTNTPSISNFNYELKAIQN